MPTTINGNHRVNFRLVCWECGSTDIRDAGDHYQCGICHARNEKMPPTESTPIVAPTAAQILNSVMTAINENFPLMITADGAGAGLASIEEFIMPNQNAGVAQSAEQGLRKSEAVGSTPISSSKYVLNKKGLPICDKCSHSIYPYPLNSTGWGHFQVPGTTNETEEPEACSSVPIPKLEPENHENQMSDNKGLNAEQQSMVVDFVHHRVAVEDNRKAADEAKKNLAATELEYKKGKALQESRIFACETQIQFHIEQMRVAEENLRRSILNDVLIKGAPEPEPTPEVAVVDHDDQIGRAG